MFQSFLNPSSRWYYPIRWLIIIFLGLAVYGQTFGFGFVFDDAGFIVNNPYIRRFDLVHYLWKIYPQTRTMGFYSFALNYQLDQLNPFGYHVFNFLIHLAAVGLVWALAALLFKIAGEAHQELPFVVALLFLVHPCQTQAVSYISQRFESMATVFYLGSIYFYLRGRISSSHKLQIFLFVCSLEFAIFGILTKEVTATIPLMVLAAEFIFFRRISIAVMAVGLFFSLLFIKLVRTDLSIFFNFHPIPSESHDGDVITLKNYLLTQMRVFLTFIRLLVLPIHQNLDYDYPLSTGLLNPPLTLAGIGVIGTAIFSVFKLRKKFPVIAFGVAWILITFAINLAPRANVIFEHKLYLISFGFFLVLVNALFIFIPQKRSLAGLLIMVIALLSISSFLRNQVWKNELTVWEDVVLKSHHKARAYNNRGSAYAQQGDFAQAVDDYNRAIALNPDYADAYYDRGDVYGKEGDLSQAIADYSKAITIIPHYVEAYNNRGDIYSRLRDYPQAMFDLNKAIEINPGFTGAYYNRGLLYDKEGYYSQAIVDYNKTIEMAPGYANAYYNRAVSYYLLKEYAFALADAYKARGLGLAIDPKFLEKLKALSGRN